MGRNFFKIKFIFILLLFSYRIGAQNSASSESNYCQNHPGEVLNLKQKGHILDHAPVLDQDGSGICAAASSSLAFNAYLRRNGTEEQTTASSSVWNLALKGAEYMTQNTPEENRDTGMHTRLEYNFQGPMDPQAAAKLASECPSTSKFPEAKPTVAPYGENQVIVKCPIEKDVDVIYGLQICDIMDQVEKDGQWCPSGDAPIEQSLFSSNLSAQGELLKSLGQFFDKTYGSNGRVNVQEMVQDFSAMSQVMWGKAAEFCHLPMEEKLAKYNALGISHPFANFSDSMTALFSESLQKLKEAREPYKEYFKNEIDLEHAEFELEHGDNGYSLETGIVKLQERLDRAVSQDAKEIYRSRLVQMQQRKSELESKVATLRPWIKENHSRYYPLSNEYMKARARVTTFSPYLNNAVNSTADWEDEGFLNSLSIDKDLVFKKVSTLSPYVSASNFLENNSYDHLLSWNGFEKQFDILREWSIPDQCKNIQYFLEMSGQGVEADIFGSCIHQDLRDPYKKLTTALGLIAGTESSKLINDFIKQLTNYTPKNNEIDVHMFFGQVLSPQCISGSQPLPATLTCDPVGVKTDEDMDVKKMSEDMIPYLSAEVPIVISVCASFLESPEPSNTKGQCHRGGAHGMAITGYRCTDTGEVEYLVQNSWGEDWCPQNKDLECVTGTGSFYVSESSLFENTIEYYLITSDTEKKAIDKEIKKERRNGQGSTFIDSFIRGKK